MAKSTRLSDSIVNERRSDWLWSALVRPMLALNIFNLAVSVIGHVIPFGFMNTFGLLSMIEGAILLVAGSTLDIASSIFGTEASKLLFRSKREYSSDHHRKQQRKATDLIVLGLVVVVESIILSLFLT
jgi:hypothetical protein